MDNYPPGAAHDPYAPYNEIRPTEVEVTVETKLVKETIVESSGVHDCVDWDIDPDTGRQVATHYRECDDDLDERYREQEDSPYEIIRKCHKLCEPLIAEKHFSYAGIYLPGLRNSCDGWEEEELSVRE